MVRLSGLLDWRAPESLASVYRTVGRVVLVAAALIPFAVATAQAKAVASPTSSALPAPLRAGAARVDITPPPSMLPAARGITPFASVHDPLYVRALAFDTGKEKAVLISVDAVILGGTDELLDDVSRELKIPRDHIFMNATHDHSTPVMLGPSPAAGAPPTYFSIVRKGVADAALQAFARLRPARIGYRTGKAYVNVNRDEKIGDHYTMGYAPEGPSDKTVAVLTVTDLADKPIAIYANYAVHGVVMFGSKTNNGQYEISGDLPGATSRYVEEQMGGDVVALWTPGAAGDQNPLFTSAYVTKDGSKDSGVGGWTLLNSQARRLGDEILRVARDTTDTVDRLGIRVRTGALMCPAQRPPGAAANINAKDPAPGKLEAVAPAPVRIPLTLMTIGDVALVGVGGELYTEIGQAVKARSPFHDTIVVTLLPDGVGYIPSDRAYTLPSEKAVTALMKPGCAETGIPATIASMANDLLQEERAGK